MKKLLNWAISRETYDQPASAATALLALRLIAGLTMAFSHGYGKLMSYYEQMDSFPDPLGLSAPVSMALAVFAEFFCGLALAAGFLTRAAVIPLIITMLVAVLIVHADDPFKKQELGLMYLAPFVAILLMGPGRLSLDAVLFGKK